MNLSTPESLKEELQKALGNLEKFEECALIFGKFFKYASDLEGAARGI